MQLPRRTDLDSAAVVLEIAKCQAQNRYTLVSQSELPQLRVNHVFQPKVVAGRVRARDSCDSHSIHCQSASLRSRAEQSCSAHLKSPVHITIEADEPGVLQIGGRNVIKREFPPGARCGIDRVGAQRPGRNLCHCGFNRRHIGQRHMFFRPPEILRCRCSRSAVANVGCTARYHA